MFRAFRVCRFLGFRVDPSKIPLQGSFKGPFKGPFEGILVRLLKGICTRLFEVKALNPKPSNLNPKPPFRDL